MAPGLNLPNGAAPEISASLFFTYLDQNRTLQAMGLWSTDTASVTGSGNPEQVKTLNVSDGTLETLGVRPMLGRWFSKDEMMPGSREAVVLMFGYWQRIHGGDRSVVGRRVTVDQRPLNDRRVHHAPRASGSSTERSTSSCPINRIGRSSTLADSITAASDDCGQAQPSLRPTQT